MNLLNISNKIDTFLPVSKSLTWINEIDNQKLLYCACVPNIDYALPVSRYLEVYKSNCFLKEITLDNGMLIFHHNYSETKLQFQEIFTDNEYFKFGINLEEGDVVFDIGSNIGLFSLFLATRFNNLTFYCFEIIPEIFNILKANIDLYNLNAKCFNYGLSNLNERANYHYYPNSTVLSGKSTNQIEVESLLKNSLNFQIKESLTKLNNHGQLEEILKYKSTKSIRASDYSTLSSVIDNNKINKIALLKIDVERDELNVLQGIKDDHWNIINQILLEVHDFENNYFSCLELLKSKGFIVKFNQPRILKGSNVYVMFANRTKAIKKSLPPILSKYKWCHSDSLVYDLRIYLNNLLPNYMIPSKIFLVDNFPISQNGKPNFEVLSKHSLSTFENDYSNRNDDNSLRSILRNIWQSVLNYKDFDDNDNFFDIGGDSFLLIQVHNKIKNTINPKIKIVDLFTFPSINTLTHYLLDANCYEI